MKKILYVVSTFVLVIAVSSMAWSSSVMPTVDLSQNSIILAHNGQGFGGEMGNDGDCPEDGTGNDGASSGDETGNNRGAGNSKSGYGPGDGTGNGGDGPDEGEEGYGPDCTEEEAIL